MPRRLRYLMPLALVLLLPAAAGAAASYDPFFASPAIVGDVGVVAPASNRAFGIAAGDFDSDNKVDLFVGRVDGRVLFLKGNGNATFAAPTLYAWKLEGFNAWPLAAGDVNGDGKLDVVFGSNVNGADAGAVTRVFDGDLRYLAGNGDGTFDTSGNYIRVGITFNAGTLITDLGTDTGSVAVGYINGDANLDIVAGGLDATGANTIVKVLFGSGGGAFSAPSTVISQPATSALASPIYYPAISTQNSPWGLSLGDADGDGDSDLWVTDRALYTYVYLNDGAGSFTMVTGNTAVSGRPNVYLGHDAVRAVVGYTASTAAGDVNGDGHADVVLGLQAGAQAPPGVAHDGEVVLDVSEGSGHTGFGILSDVGTVARGVTLIDVNGDGARDIVSGNYEGQVVVQRQLPPLDTDGDGVSDYVDNAPTIANAARVDMNTDASVNHRDQLDNDFDTVLGNPEDSSTWQRLGDPADPDDDNDGVGDAVDNCPFVGNTGQENVDGDDLGDACDPLDDRDLDSDGVPTGPLAGDPGYDLHRNASIKWSNGSTRFVIRIDALGRFFQNEFTQLMTDAATLSPADWATKCWENYDPADFTPAYEPCGDDATKTLTLAGGKSVPVSIITIPKQLWTDPPVVAWINDRNANPRFDLGLHQTYHVNNVPISDWAGMADRNFYSCELCGLSEAEVFELGRVGYGTLVGNYANKWVAESGATAGSPKIDWSDAAYPLISYAPPFNTSDTTGREAVAQLGFKAFSASVYEEGEAGSYGPIFTPEGSHHEQFDQFGMFHVSADLQLNPPATSGGTYNATAFGNYLEASTQDGGLNTWLIEEVDWSGRPCNDADRLGTCNGGSNREDNTVYSARWDAWMQVLDYVNNYPGGVAMTMAEVGLAKAYDNAPTAANPGQTDSDHDGIGNAIDGAVLTGVTGQLPRTVPGTLSASLVNGAGNPIAGQAVRFTFDADGNGTGETYSGTTGSDGVAKVTVTATGPVGPTTFTVDWDGLRLTATDQGSVSITSGTTLVLADAVATRNSAAVARATLTDVSGAQLAGKSVSFHVGTKVKGQWVFERLGAEVTNASGVASFTIPAKYVSTQKRAIRAVFAGDDDYLTATADAFVYRQ